MADPGNPDDYHFDKQQREMAHSTHSSNAAPAVPNKPKPGRARLDEITMTNYPEFSRTVVGGGT